MGKASRGGRAQYTANLALKVNAKIGGGNARLSDRDQADFMQEPFMVLGADVTHPVGEVPGVSHDSPLKVQSPWSFALITPGKASIGYCLAAALSGLLQDECGSDACLPACLPACLCTMRIRTSSLEAHGGQ